MASGWIADDKDRLRQRRQLFGPREPKEISAFERESREVAACPCGGHGAGKMARVDVDALHDASGLPTIGRGEQKRPAPARRLDNRISLHSPLVQKSAAAGSKCRRRLKVSEFGNGVGLWARHGNRRAQARRLPRVRPLPRRHGQSRRSGGLTKANTLRDIHWNAMRIWLATTCSRGTS